MPDESIWNRKLFETPAKLETFRFRANIGFMVFGTLFLEWLVLRSFPKFDLISKYTAIPGGIAFTITQIGVIGSVWAIVTYLRNRAPEMRHGIHLAWAGSLWSTIFMGRPAKFERVNVESYAEGYPAIFGFAVIFLCLSLAYLALLTWKPARINAWINMQ